MSRPPILCEAWAHVGRPKPAQKNKVLADALKLVWGDHPRPPYSARRWGVLRTNRASCQVSSHREDATVLTAHAPAVLRYDFSVRANGVERHFPPLIPFAYESELDALRTAIEVAFSLSPPDRADVTIATFVADQTGTSELPGSRRLHHQGPLSRDALAALSASKAA